MDPQNMSVAIEDMFNLDFSIPRVGTPTLESPLKDVIFVEDSERISYCADPTANDCLRAKGMPIPAFIAAGPRRLLYHDAAWTRAAIVTCGGLCPGLNDVIKSLVNTLYYVYGVDNIFGIQYGYSGLVPSFGLKPISLTPDVVDAIHTTGGTILGSSRGEQSTEEIVRTLDRLNINILFTIGGDGTQRGAHDIAVELKKRNLPISVVGIPKTIDNDLNFMDKTFGFETAVQETGPIISCAHNEAKGAFNGIGLVRLMGRDSGFIAANASLANSLVNFCLIPEVEFQLRGEHGFLEALEHRLLRKHHAVIVVAEGAGQNLITDDSAPQKDKSGNILHKDIGLFLKDMIIKYFKERKIEISMKYFDPSYIIRSTPTCGMDSIFCLNLAQHAVHAAMAGMTDLVVGNWQGYFTYVPIPLATMARRKIDPRGQLWQSVLLTTRQNQDWK
ncbi:ATP-dependent 6-phosphofructokinase [Oligosphaera ethanolica]|uniref:6-phosphofructokinase 1 n=1 Tax=Oligosphaera ethanolica TaxID=760260 RepID=A0AAE4AM86_9BACT|nr:ATP-dependent 6-phosphofructokinase [Oligosphaera ethanolica]MDQ0288221.1 6-phosphofructokinase 1 [Oligosphaera ethanolica]